MKRLAGITALALLAVAGARANGISITLDNPDQRGIPGDTLSFFGTITNTDPVPGDPAVYLNADSLNLLLADALTDDHFYDAWFPISLAPGESSGRSDLFEVQLANPETRPFGSYSGSYGLQGGMDGGDQSALAPLAQVDFTVEVTAAPEPGTTGVLAIGLLLIALAARRRPGQRA